MTCQDILYILSGKYVSVKCPRKNFFGSAGPCGKYRPQGQVRCQWQMLTYMTAKLAPM